MQNPANSGTYGTSSNSAAAASSAAQYAAFLATPNVSSTTSSSNTSNARASSSAADLEGDLPSSLPSYMPPPQPPQLPQPPQPPQGGMAYYSTPYSNDSTDSSSLPSSAKRQAPVGQWKTPPQFLYPASRSSTTTATVIDTPDRTTGAASPSTGIRSMTFHDSATVANTAANTITTTATRKLTRQEIGGISAAQFAASTGGLTMDTALLARVSGTDPSQVGTEEIKQIMRTPDLLSIYQKLQEEDDRRQRRLERNRASARVRREKKKSLVETYEAEVSKLENSLNLLKLHAFGDGRALELSNALEYSSGEHLRHAMMSKDAKMELLARILGHHARSTDAIHRANRENQALLATATDDSELFQSLRQQLRLSDAQCQQLAQLEPLVQDERRQLDAIAKCFAALRAHDWLFFPGIETILHQTRSTMSTPQFQRFLTWTLDNRDVLDQLPVVPFAAPPATADSDLDFRFDED